MMKHRQMRALSRLLAALLTLMTLAVPALAETVQETETPTEPYVELSTPYPSMTVNAGDEMTVELAIDNYSGASQDFALFVEQIPEGWTGDFSADGQRVSRVHARNGEVIDTVALEVEIPLETEAGEYEIVLEGCRRGFLPTCSRSPSPSAPRKLGNSSFEVEYRSRRATRRRTLLSRRR